MRVRHKIRGHLRVPSAAELQECAARDFIRLEHEEAEGLIPLVTGLLEMLDEVEELPPLEVPLKHPFRDPGHVPTETEDPYNAFTRLCRVEGALSGPLTGRTIAVKDNLALAGIPITNGSRMASFTPTTDAVVIERLLDAGGTIVGKLNLDDFSASGFGETSFFGPARNPRDPSRSTGGSSGGAGSAVASGAVDIAIGVDQGGSARVPAAFCGCVTIKATHGLVPSFGVTHYDHTLDNLCPMAQNVLDVATTLAVIAGDDWRDPQWVRLPPKAAALDAYVDAADQGVQDLRIGVIAETVDPTVCEQAVVTGVERATKALGDSGGHITSISIPLFTSAFSVWMGIVLGDMPAMIRSDGMGYGHLGYVDVDRVHSMGNSRRQEGTLFPPLIKLLMITNAFVEKMYCTTVFAKAHNQRLALRRAIDDVFSRYDLLLTPTTPTTAPVLPKERMGDAELMARAAARWPLTAAFNVTGHPALAMPSGVDDAGLPTSVQIVGKRFAERDVFRAAFLLEKAFHESIS